ncbi:MAG: DinB family protein [Actinomycetota bacterium]|nr:DinB family protein [Actinomycetota bacterium]
MPDRKPPRLAGDERETLHALLQYHRDSLVRKVSGIDDETARRRFVGTDTTLLWLVKHATGAEARWVLCSFARQVENVRDDAVGIEDTLADAVSDYQATWARVDAVVSAASLDDECRAVSGDDTVNLRWIITHLLEETARHAGHADILRELIDGQVGR